MCNAFIVVGCATWNGFLRNTVSYHVATDDVFPALSDIDVSVILECSAVFNSSDGTVLPNDSTKCSITAKPESETLTVNYKVLRERIETLGK